MPRLSDQKRFDKRITRARKEQQLELQCELRKVIETIATGQNRVRTLNDNPNRRLLAQVYFDPLLMVLIDKAQQFPTLSNYRKVSFRFAHLSTLFIQTWYDRLG